MQIIEWDGKKISKPGIYKGVPMEDYHSDICVEPSISSSGTRTIENESLAHFFDGSYLNPDRAPPKDTDYFALGSAAHHLVAGDGDFEKLFPVRPVQWDSWRTKDAKAWRAEKRLAGLTVLAPDDIDVIRGLASSLHLHPTIKAGILSGLVEHSIFWPVEVMVTMPDGSPNLIRVWCKSRPDFIPIESNMIVDLKTCASADGHSCRRSITDFGYHQQFALAHDGLLATTGRTMTDHVPVFIEKKRPHCINIKPIGAMSIAMGRRQNMRSLIKFAHAIATGEWPGYEDDEVPCEIMGYLQDRLDYDVKNGLLPEIDDAPPAIEAEPI